MTENFQVRDVFNPKVVNALAQKLKTVWQPFDAAGFCEMIIPNLPPLTFSERLKLIYSGLAAHLPKDFPAAVDILLKALPSPLEKEELDGYDGFIIVPQSHYVSQHGMAHFDLSMNALYEMTKRFSVEFDIRFFIESHPEKTLAVLTVWAKDESPHVRRLVSEGTRPLLPWAKRLKDFEKNPAPALALLEHLKNDPALLVRRSVANHLNDVAKSHGDLVVATLQRWKKEHPGKEMDWLIRHATRTLIKRGHPGALALLGFQKGAEVKVENLRLASSKINLGEHLEFSFDLVSTAADSQDLVIDYVLYFMKNNGSLAPKVFKMTARKLAAGERVS
ncbi:MAG: DNA alkylation repair protein, partial [Bacteroidota bacterium]